MADREKCSLPVERSELAHAIAQALDVLSETWARKRQQRQHQAREKLCQLLAEGQEPITEEELAAFDRELYGDDVPPRPEPLDMRAKISVSVDQDEFEWAKTEAEARDLSLSALVNEALRDKRQQQARLRLLKELGTDDISDADRAAMRAELREAGLEF